MRVRTRIAMWWLGRANRKMFTLVKTNRAERRRDSRKIAGRSGDRRAIYRALKGREVK